MAYAIGLDIGIASVGWAVVELDQDENPWGIVNLGSRIFDAAENPKDGASLAAPRREARSARRRLRRRRHRLERIRNLLVSFGLVTLEQLQNMYSGIVPDVYALRVQGLDERLSDEEIARVLLHLAHRRGFKSNRKSDAADKENGAILSAVNSNKSLLASSNYRTVGEMFFKDPLFAEFKRNKAGTYLTTVGREQIETEAKLIIVKQRELGNTKLTLELEAKYLDILLGQRQFDEGPGGNSPYGGSQIERMIGKCTFERQEPCAAKACYFFEYFNLLQQVNHLRLVQNGSSESLDDEQRAKVIKLAFDKPTLNYTHLRKVLNLGEDVRFNNLFYAVDKDVKEVEKKQKFEYLTAYHKIKKAFGTDEAGRTRYLSLKVKDLNAIGNILSIYKGDDKRREKLKEVGLQPEDIEALLPLNFSKFGRLSLKALDKIIPFMEKGAIYNEACEQAGYDFRSHAQGAKQFLLPTLCTNPKVPSYNEEVNARLESITSPVVRRSVSQTIKVVNAIIRQQGESPLYINVELARELAKNFDERNQARKSMEENRSRNDHIREEIVNTYHYDHPTGQDIVKLKLWQEQDGISPYSQKRIEAASLFDPGYAEVDHIVPYSISFDDTMNNKVLVLAKENQEKRNRLPLEYLQDKGQAAVDAFKVHVNNSCKNYRKKQKLLKEHISVEDVSVFKERNLQDTKTMARFLYNYFNDFLQFAESEQGRKKHVTAVNGAITAYLRKRWGIAKVRENGDRHHAVDAAVIACANDGLIQRVQLYSEQRESSALREKFPEPWQDFRKELEARASDVPIVALTGVNSIFYLNRREQVQPIFVSRMPRRKATGAAHAETNRSAKLVGEGKIITKTPLTKLKLAQDKETKAYYIEGYYNPQSDLLLYNALLQRLEEFKGKADIAFAEPFHKPKADGTPGPVVNKVKIVDKSTLNVPVLQGNAVAANGDMVRVDVFYVEKDGYYLVPIYVADTLKKDLPNRAIVQGKPYSEWKEMRDENFVFSLYPNDLVRVVHKKGITFSKVSKDSDLPEKYEVKEMLCYYKQASISTGSITVINDDNTYFIPSLGVKTLQSLEKCTVDVLGKVTVCEKETRQKFH